MTSPRRAEAFLVVAALSLTVAACERSQRAARSVEPVAAKTTKKVEKGARATGAAVKPAADKVAKGVNKGVQGIKKGGEAVGRAFGAK